MRPRIDHNKRLKLILENAFRLFSELGYPQFTLRFLAERCQLSRTVLYRYYKSKREVFDGVLEMISGSLKTEFQEYVQEHPETPASEKIRIILTRVAAIMEEHSAFLDALVEFLIDRRRDGEQVRRRVMRYTIFLRLTLVRLIREGVDRREFIAVHCTQIGEIFYEQLMGAAMQIAVTETHSPDGFRNRLDLTLAALKNLQG